MRTAMENLKSIVDVNTIVGQPVHTPDGHTIIPISKVGFGFGAGGSEFKVCCDKPTETKKTTDNATHTHPDPHPDYPFGGGSGGGVSITPVAFIIIGNNEVKLLSTDGPSHLYDRLFDVVEKLTHKKKKPEVTEPPPGSCF